MQQYPAFIICSYTRDGNHFYLHIPKRSAEQCNLTSGCRFLGFIRENKLVIEQEYTWKVENAVVGNRPTATEPNTNSNTIGSSSHGLD
jgi:hypothetical protein